MTCTWAIIGRPELERISRPKKTAINFENPSEGSINLIKPCAAQLHVGADSDVTQRGESVG
jgi:hypothetical protein